MRKAPADELSDEEREVLREHYLLRLDPPSASLRAGQRELRRRIAAIQDGFQEIMVMRERVPPVVSHVLERGGYGDRREPVASRTPGALPPMDPELPRNRLGLARWMTGPDHPLTARVTVNRYWQMFFGRGLVSTPEDFGSQGSLPTHPQLLDWLARDFIDHGWDLKRLVRQMVSSRAYRQESAAPPELLREDPQNLWLGRAPRYRWTAEMIRDSVLHASGLLVPRIGGPPARPYEVAASFKPSEPDKGPGLHRRSLYTYWQRTAPAPAMRTLDAAKREVCSVRRETTATPLQAFVFLNDPQFVEAARFLARRALDSREGPGALEEIFRSLIGRRPGEGERAVLDRMLGEQRAYFQEHPDRVEPFLSVGEGRLPGREPGAEWGRPRRGGHGADGPRWPPDEAVGHGPGSLQRIRTLLRPSAGAASCSASAWGWDRWPCATSWARGAPWRPTTLRGPGE